MNEKMLAELIHIGTNMWSEADNKETTEDDMPKASLELRCDWDVWYEYIDALKAVGVNTLILDLGDGIKYESHPEIAVEGAWSVDELKKEIDRLRKMGFELIPKLNFSTTHDYWLKEYAMMVSTPIYYKVCADLIAEVCEIFKPSYFHIGMDEENYTLQKKYDYVVIRQHGALWKDIKFLVAEVEKHGARAIMWANHMRDNREEFLANFPKSAIPMMWFYYNKFYGELPEFDYLFANSVKTFVAEGFPLIMTGSVYYYEDNFEKLAQYCMDEIPPEQLLGLCQTTWWFTVPEEREKLLKSAETIKKVHELYNP